MKFTSILDKLLALVREVLVMVVSTLVLILAIAGGLYVQSELKTIEKSMRKNIAEKGTVLIVNNSTALRGMAEDNAFLAIRELVSSTVQDDPDIAYGIFMDAGRRPWAYYWSDTGDVAGMNEILDDTVSLWADTVSAPANRMVYHNHDQFIEFAAPVMSDEIRMGTIRYGIGTRRMQLAINDRKHGVYQMTIVFAVSILCVLVVTLLVGSLRARKQAFALTMPLGELRTAAGRIAEGDYSQKIDASTDDEVGDLARSFDEMRRTIKEYNDNLERMVKQRTEELETAQKELVEKAHKAGMADIATGTLHNVGNILNSVMTSVHLLGNILDKQSIDGLSKANVLLKANMDDLETFMCRDTKGPKLMQYYIRLEDVFNEEREQIRAQLERLSDKVNTITDVISAQQNYAGSGALTEDMSLEAIIDDALTMQSGSIEKYSISVVKKFENVPRVKAQKTKLIHILINLIKNAKEAMTDVDPTGRILTIETLVEGDSVQARVSDSGSGIPEENLNKIFSHGFSTKEGGHGFGLHSCANYMTEMSGEIRAESGRGQAGTTFILSFPRA